MTTESAAEAYRRRSNELMMQGLWLQLVLVLSPIVGYTVMAMTWGREHQDWREVGGLFLTFVLVEFLMFRLVVRAVKARVRRGHKRDEPELAWLRHEGPWHVSDHEGEYSRFRRRYRGQ